MPTIRAGASRAASVRVVCPGPHPKSTTHRARTRPARARKASIDGSNTRELCVALRGEIDVAERIVCPHATASYPRAHCALGGRDAGRSRPGCAAPNEWAPFAVGLSCRSLPDVPSAYAPSLVEAVRRWLEPPGSLAPCACTPVLWVFIAIRFVGTKATAGPGSQRAAGAKPTDHRRPMTMSGVRGAHDSLQEPFQVVRVAGSAFGPGFGASTASAFGS
jgi:hypothetical protein